MLPAARTLLDSGRLPVDTVFCPGQTIATPSEHTFRNFLPWMDTEDIIEYILKQHFSLWKWDNGVFRGIERQRIATALPTSGTVSLTEAAAAYEKWEWEERQGKFMNSDGRQYEFLGADWWFPLWDREFVDFWAMVPLKYRRNKKLIRQYVTEKYSEVADISLREAKKNNQNLSVINRVKTKASNSPLGPILQPIHQRIVTDETALSGEQWGWYGIVPEEQLSELRTSASSIYSFRVLEALDRLSFQPPRREPGLLQNNEITLPVNKQTVSKGD